MGRDHDEHNGHDWQYSDKAFEGRCYYVCLRCGVEDSRDYSTPVSAMGENAIACKGLVDFRPVTAAIVRARAFAARQAENSKVLAAGGAENTALKADDGKLRYDLLSPEFEEQMALALTHGAKKYDDRNYLKGDGLELKRPLAALRRHLAALLKGQDTDEDSKAHHAACVAVNAMFLYDLMTKKGRKF